MPKRQRVVTFCQFLASSTHLLVRIIAVKPSVVEVTFDHATVMHVTCRDGRCADWWRQRSSSKLASSMIVAISSRQIAGHLLGMAAKPCRAIDARINDFVVER